MLFDFAELPANERYKLLVSTVLPRPIAWVVSLDAEGRRNAAPFSFFNVFTDDPPVVAIGMGDRGPGLKDSVANIRATGQFTVCLVPAERLDAMNITAADFTPEVDELAEAGLTTLPSAKIKPPRIAESPVALECETHELVRIGRHTLVLGRVVAMHVRDDCVLNPEKHYIDSPKLGLVGRMHGRGWYARTTDLVEVPRITPEQWAARKAAE
jgi:flavin reductase (DIM6/NTAB) family NADH-FMN oxidoreductase RutF